TRSQGASLGIGSSGVNSVGFNQSKADENSKTVLLTSMTAKQVNINTQAHTQLTGSLIAATDTGDKDGNDNGQLNLTTNSLSASSLNTTTNNKSISMGLNAGGNANTNSAKLNRVNLDYTNNKHNSKTKVLATLGSGNIQIADIDQNNSNSKSKSNSNSKSKSKSKSSTKLLNRDIKDTEVNIYNIASHKGLKGEIDTRLLTKNGRIQIAKDIKKSGMITSAIQQIVNTDRTELKDFFSEVDKLHKTDEAVTAKIANNPALAKALTDPNLTPTQKQQLAKELVGSVMVELGYKAPEVKIVANTNTNTNTNTNDNDNTNDNRAGHYGEDNNIYLNDTNINNTKDLTTTIGHETSHALDNQDPSINTNPQNDASKTDNEIYADNYGDDFGDYVEFASENYGDGNLASTNNRNLGNTPAETQRNTKLVERNNQDYARIDKSKGEDSVVKITTTGIKIINKIRKIKGKLTKEKLKKIFKDEGIDIADDLTTLVDGKIGVDDALAILDLAVGTNLNSKKVKVIKSKNNYQYKPAPKKPEDIKGIPNLKEVRKKTFVQGGGNKRARYEDKKGNIYEWDYRHGTLEKYNKRGKHLGEYNPKTGKQLKPANKTRRVEP
ncbi:hypothetical protein BPUTSESOX_160, partial [uncultured Gammaproteobacteria bacterium]